MAQHRIIALSNPRAGREIEYVDWYVTRHIRDLMAIDGVVGDQFFTAAHAAVAWRHLGLYTIADGRISDVMETIAQTKGTERMVLTDAMDPDSVAFLTAELLDKYNVPDDENSPFRYLALSASISGEQDEVDRWLKTQHITDILNVPGFTGAERLHLRGDRRGGNPAWTRACIFWAHGDTASGLLGRVAERAASGQLPTCHALDRLNCYVAMYQRVPQCWRPLRSDPVV